MDALMIYMDDYLEISRTTFPRLYGVADAELLQLLAMAGHDLKGAVQLCVSKVFHGICKLEYGEGDQAEEIVAILSAQDEKVLLSKHVKVAHLPTPRSSMRCAADCNASNAAGTVSQGLCAGGKRQSVKSSLARCRASCRIHSCACSTPG